MSHPLSFRPAIIMGIRLAVEAYPDRFTMKRPLRKAVEVRLAEIRYFGVDRGHSHSGLAGASVQFYIRTGTKLLKQPLDVNDAETQRFCAWLGAALPQADVSSKAWPTAAQLLGVGKGMRLWSSPMFVIGLALVFGGMAWSALQLGAPSGASSAFKAGYRSAPLVVIAIGATLAIVGWRRHVKRERAAAEHAKADRFD